jgi:hypothetical protein
VHGVNVIQAAKGDKNWLFGIKLGLQPLPKEYFVWLVGILIVYSLMAQTVKSWFIKKFGYN